MKEKKKNDIPKRDSFFSLMFKYNKRDYSKDKEEGEKIELEKNDKWALFFSALLVIFLPSIIILGLVVFLTLLIFNLL